MNRGMLVLALIASAWSRLMGQDPLLPSDTSFLLVINARAALQSKTANEIAIPWFQALIGKAPHIGQMIDVLGIDPLRDLLTLSIATGSTTDQDRMVIVFRGNWNRETVGKRLHEKSMHRESGLALINPGVPPVFQWACSPGKLGPIFVTVTPDGAIVSSMSKGYLEQAVRPNSKANLTGRHLLEKIPAMTPKTLAVAAVSGESIDWSMVPEGKARDTFKSSRGLAAQLSLNQIETELNLELFLESADTGTATANRQAIDDLAGQSLGYVEMLVDRNPKYKAVQTALKSTRNESKGSTVRIRAAVPLSEVRELLNPGQPAQGKQN